MYDPDCFDDLLNRPWIMRAWTFQEIILPRNIILVCGEKSLPWLTFLRGMAFTSTSSRAWHLDIYRLSNFQNWMLLTRIWIAYPRQCSWDSQKFWASKSNPPGYNEIMASRILIFLLLTTPCAILIGLLSLIQDDVLSIILNITTCIGVAVTFIGPTFIVHFSKILQPLSTEFPVNMAGGLITALRERISDKPEDKAYAFYGVLGALDLKPHYPNLQNTLGQVYHQFFCDLIEWNVSLVRLLMDVGSGKREGLADAPTWVPAFNDFSLSWLDPDYLTGDCPFLAAPVARSDFKHIAADLEPSAPESRKQLTMPGQFKGTASFCSGSFDTDSTLPRQTSRGHKFIAWFRALRSMACLNEPNTDMSDTIYPVLQGRVATLDSNPAPELSAFRAWFRDFIEGLDGERRPDPGPSGEDCSVNEADFDVSDEFAGRLSTMNSSGYFVERCRAIIRARRNLFISSEGHAGSGPENMMEGDRIVLLGGVPVPMVLREVDDGTGRFTVLGAAFVHGLMEDGGWEEGETRDIILI